MNILLWAFIVSVGINILMFLPAFKFKTDKLTDISYAVTFAVVAFAAYSRSEQTLAHTVMLLAVLAWSLRLGGFLLIRINKMSKDSRFDFMRDKFFSFLQFWLLQGVSVFVVLVGSILVWQEADTTVTALSWFGLTIFAVGLVLEATADYQKFLFRFSGKAKKHEWIDEGVWRMSRHPNYLGEMMVWTGLYLFALPSLSGLAVYAGLISPLYIVSLLLFVSGVSPLEKSADRKWGKQESYRQYKKEVPVLLPTPSSIKRAL
ncbi:DUF1295 domain-containing protein [soil metagenome]